MNHRLAPLALVPALLLSLAFVVGCANESTPYTDKTAEIDPAMNMPDPSETEPTADADKQDATTPDVDDQVLTAGLGGEKKVELTDAQWKQVLSREEYDILRQSGTEYAGTGRYNDHPKDKKGAFHCVGCGNKLYDAKHKFHSGCGWPSFNQEVEPGAITLYRDASLGTVRTEMRCARCDGHLGHVFEDGHLWDQETGKRHCVNGNILIFVPEGADVKEVIRKHREKYASR